MIIITEVTINPGNLPIITHRDYQVDSFREAIQKFLSEEPFDNYSYYSIWNMESDELITWKGDNIPANLTPDINEIAKNLVKELGDKYTTYILTESSMAVVDITPPQFKEVKVENFASRYDLEILFRDIIDNCTITILKIN